MLEIGQQLQVTIEDVAHGGLFIARHEGIVIFVRGADIGEDVLIEITKIGAKQRFFFADSVAIIKPSATRITAPCPYVTSCGGCDFQHLEIAHQRELKKRVILNSLKKFAGIDISRWEDFPIQQLKEFHYRTRMRYQETPDGDYGLHAAQSNSIVLIDECAIATKALTIPQGEIAIQSESFQGFTSSEEPIEITERVSEFAFQLDSECFWQAHKDAPRTFLEIVMRLADLKFGETVVDLYSGVGLFSLASSVQVGASGKVLSVEGDKRSARYLERNARPYANISTYQSEVAKWLENHKDQQVDVVILDPPRKGAGQAATKMVTAQNPRAIVYVACDPVALARDIGFAQTYGYELTRIEAVDAFPQTHHVETFALLTQARLMSEEK